MTHPRPLGTPYFALRGLPALRMVLTLLCAFGVALEASSGGLESVPSHSCVAPTRPASGGPIQVELEEVLNDTGANQVLAMVTHASDPGTYYSASRWGSVYRISGTASPVEVLSASPYSASEGGLLGIALHPEFDANGQIYLNYTRSGGAFAIQTVVSRFTSADGGLTFGPEEVIFTVDQPTTIHNAGDIHFGADGFLCIALGDGGAQATSQDASNVLGSILRIDVDSGSPYGIPPTNPFAAGGGAPEIYAWGLRNPYRWGFDPATGDLWVGDVGQALEEEVDVVTIGGELRLANL